MVTVGKIYRMGLKASIIDFNDAQARAPLVAYAHVLSHWALGQVTNILVDVIHQ